MNNNYNGNYNMNQSAYTTVDEHTHLTMLRHIAKRRAEIIYQIQQQEYNEAAEAKAQNDLINWAESPD